VLRVQIFNVLFAAFFFFALPFAIEPKTNLAIYLGISTALLIVWRLYIFPRMIDEKSMNVLVLGDSEEARAIARIFVSNPYFKNVRPYALGSSDVENVEEMKASLLRFVEEKGVDMIIADLRDPFVKNLTKEFYRIVFEKENVQFFDLASMYEELHNRILPSLVGEEWVLQNVRGGSPHYAYDSLKQVIDVCGAFLVLIPCIVIFPLIALAIKLQDGGPIFYISERVGQNNKPIRIYKFRSMTGMDSGMTLDTKFVVTPVGKFLRKTRLDELPQLWNVLRGDLSFIGPRPELPARAAVYAENIPYYNLRHLIKPGLSGWAQINNFEVPRGEVDVVRTIEKLSFDLYYLKHRSIFLDIEIALKTLNTLLMRSGT
jgi:lipopolysaccharide/colanic/teichoic acid biosynthesis glycosyltransferase